MKKKNVSYGDALLDMFNKIKHMFLKELSAKSNQWIKNNQNVM